MSASPRVLTLPPPPSSASIDESTRRYLHHFKWESSEPSTVSIKGSFDNWSSALELQKQPSGTFIAPIQLEFGSTISYKYVIDGVWRHDPNEPTETDPNGNINNVLQVPQRPTSPLANLVTQSSLTSSDPIQSSMSFGGVVDQGPDQTLAEVVQDLPNRPEGEAAAEPSPDPDMSVIFPSASADNLPELVQQPIKPPNPKRTTSLFATSARRIRPSYRAHSLLTAPGTPSEKASPADASLSNVVSALVGVAATAVPAAIQAVTGKDILATSSPTNPEDISSHVGPEPTPQQLFGDKSQEPSQADNPTRESILEEVSHANQDPNSNPSEAALLVTMPVNDAAENPKPLDTESDVGQATHQTLPSSSAAVKTEATTTTVEAEPSPANALETTDPPAPVAEPVVAASLSGQKPRPAEVVAAPADANKPSETKPKNISHDRIVKQDSPPRVSFSEERPEPPANNNCKIGRQSPQGFSTPTPREAGTPKLTGSLSTPQQASIDPTAIKSSPKKEESISKTKKTSGWRYSIGSIRSRRASGEQEPRSVSENRHRRHSRDSAGETSGNEQARSTTNHERKSGILQRIKTVLNPRSNKNSYSSNGNRSKRNSLARTATITSGGRT